MDKERFLKTIGAAIRSTRETIGMTQQSLASKIGVSRAWVTIMESGRGNPSVSTLKAIAEALGVDFIISGRNKED